MSALTAQRRRGRMRTGDCERSEGARGPGDDSPTLFEEVSGASTLDALVSGLWEQLTERRPAVCPVCGGRMVASEAAHAQPVGGRCTDCGTSLL